MKTNNKWIIVGMVTILVAEIGSWLLRDLIQDPIQEWYRPLGVLFATVGGAVVLIAKLKGRRETTTISWWPVALAIVVTIIFDLIMIFRIRF